MCLIVLGWRVLPDYPLLVAANRDEFHGRPAASAAFWSDRPSILAGRDLEANGTWMGLARTGRFAAVTNYRGAREPRAIESRGALVTKFLESGASAAEYVNDLVPRSAAYSGFNLLATDGAELWWLSNRGGEASRLEPGIHGLGNTLLDAPEVEDAKRRFEAAITPAPAVEPLFEALLDAKIVNAEYGTRCSTILLKRGDGRMHYAERGFSPDGAAQDTVHYLI